MDFLKSGNKLNDTLGDIFTGRVKSSDPSQVEDANRQAELMRQQFLEQAVGYDRASPQMDLSMFQNAATGNAPSVAQLQLQQGQAQNVQDQMALQASQRGAYSPAVARQALAINAEGQQKVNSQAAMLRAQEMAQARQSYLQGLQANQGAELQARSINDSAQNNLRNLALNANAQRQQGASTLFSGQNQANIAQAQSRSQAFGSLFGAGAGLLGSMVKGGGKGNDPETDTTNADTGAGTGGEGMAHGGYVPGRAQITGDSPSNDTVPTKLSPGELVVPRSVVAQGPHAIAAFAQSAPPSFGSVMASLSDLHAKVAQLEERKSKKKIAPEPIKMASGGYVPTSFDPDVDSALAAIPPPPAPAPAPAPAARQVADLQPMQQLDAPGAGEVEPALMPQTQGAPLFAPPKMMETGAQSATSFEKGRTLPAASKQALADANEGQQDAVQAKADVDTAKANEQASVFSESVEAAKKADADLAQKEAARNAQLDTQMAEYKKTLTDIQKTPNQTFWEKQGTSGKVLGGIAMALGALGSGLTHGPNYAMEIINKAIDDDFQQQKMDLLKKKDVADGQLSLYGQMRAKFGDERQSDLATKRAMLDNAELQLKSVASKYQGQDSQANAQVAIAGLQEQKAKLDAEFALASQDKVTTNKTSTKQLTQAPGALDPERVIDLPTGGKALLATVKDRDKVIEHNVEFADMKDQLTELQDLNKKYGSQLFRSDAAAKAKMLSASLNQKFVRFQGLNRFTSEEKELFEHSVLPDDPSGVWKGLNASAQINNLQKVVDSSHNRFMKLHGVIPLSGVQGLPDDPSQMQNQGIKLVRTGLKK